ncbi:MAG: ACT domain-containing protein [Oscillospiraceae bacterium]|nr:ACT domain-containing protein [Oscillospiraceae bacterium]
MAYEVSITENVTLISLNDSPSDIGVTAKIFEFLSKNDIDVDMISQIPPHASTPCLSFTVNDDDLGKVFTAASSLRELLPEVKLGISSGNSKISVFGEDMKNCPGIASKVFSAIAEVGAEVRMITTSEVDISILVFSHDSTAVYSAIKKVF